MSKSDEYKSGFDEGYSEGYDDGVLECDNTRKETLSEVMEQISETIKQLEEGLEPAKIDPREGLMRVGGVMELSNLRQWLRTKMEELG